VVVEKTWDELWIGVKSQSNPEIAGSPRNSFRASLRRNSTGGRALMGCGVLKGYQSLSNSECLYSPPWSQSMGAKLHTREGKNPDRQLRSPRGAKCKRM
jgi:hypothetical protein